MTESSDARITTHDVLGLVPATPVLAGVIVYGVSAYGYDSFYWDLGTSPGEAGLGYGEILTAAIPAMALIAVLTTFLVVLLPALASGIRRLRKRTWPQHHGRRRKPPVWVIATVAGIAVCLGILGGHYVKTSAKHRAATVRAGHGVSSIRVLGFTLIHLDVPEVNVAWVGQGSPPSDVVGPHVQLRELGHTDAWVVLYRSKIIEGRLVSGPLIVPASSVIVARY